MTSPDTILFISFGYLITKHFLGDFVFQNIYQLTNKVHYGHPGGLLHAGIHGALSLPLFFLLPAPAFSWFAAIILGEMIAHYHLDWAKEQLLKKTKWTPRDNQFWRLFGFDQFLHLVCYLIMVALLVN